MILRPILRQNPTWLALVLVIVAGTVRAAAAETAETGASGTVQVAAVPITALLPDGLGRIKAADNIKQYSPDALEALAGVKTPIYKEYKVTSAASRTYGALRVDVFECQTRSGAFGLFSYNSDAPVATAITDNHPAASAAVANGIFLWRGNLFVHIGPAAQGGAAGRAALSQLASLMSAQMASSGGTLKTPTLVESLPRDGAHQPAARYFLGPQSLSDYLPRGSDMFAFGGEAEAVLATYKQGGSGAPPLKLAIVEYNTPQFAHDALERANGLVSSLAPAEQSKIIVKRIGNYIVEASDVADRAAAERLVNSINYPYTVKWFQVPFHRKEDPHAGQKAAQIILSSFGIIGLLLSSALMGGGLVGAIIFMKRRKEQRAVFSDAGGMLRLDIEELCTGVAALPEASGRRGPEDELS